MDIRKGEPVVFDLATTCQVLAGPEGLKRIRITSTETDGTKAVHIEHAAFVEGKTLVPADVETIFVAALPVEITVGEPVGVYGSSVFPIGVLAL